MDDRYQCGMQRAGASWATLRHGGGIGHGCQLVSKQPLPGVIRIPSQRLNGPIGSPSSAAVLGAGTDQGRDKRPIDLP